MSAARLVWELAGRPDVDGATGAMVREHRAVCVMCGRTGDRTAPANRAMGANFTDQYLYTRPDSVDVCVGCLWCCAGKPPKSLRMWTICAAPGRDLPPNAAKAWLPSRPGLCLTSRGNPAPVIDLLLHPPETDWVCSVALSGQKHVVPYARVNRGRTGWTVRLENTDVSADSDTWATVLAATATLRAAGHSGDDVLAGQPTLAKIATLEDLEWWRHWSAPLTDHTGSPLLTLALWCLTTGGKDKRGTILDHAHT